MSTLPDDLRAVLHGLADEMIPAGSGLPSANEVGMDAHLVDAVLTVRPDLTERLVAVLRPLVGVAPDLALAKIADHPESMDVVALVVAGGYLMSSDVAAVLKYPFQEGKLVRSDELFRDIEAGLLDQVIEKGPIYRLPDDAPAEARRAWK